MIPVTLDIKIVITKTYQYFTTFDKISFRSPAAEESCFCEFKAMTYNFRVNYYFERKAVDKTATAEIVATTNGIRRLLGLNSIDLALSGST